MYNTITGEIVLSQIIDRLTYIYTIQTIYRFFPIEIITSDTLKNKILMKKLESVFTNCKFKYIKR